MNVSQKVAILQEAVLDSAEFDQILNKLFDVVISQYRNRSKRYARDLQEFEERYQLDSAKFYRRFEAGEMGDSTDFFEWAGLFEIYQAVQQKIRQLETVV